MGDRNPIKSCYVNNFNQIIVTKDAVIKKEMNISTLIFFKAPLYNAAYFYKRILQRPPQL